MRNAMMMGAGPAIFIGGGIIASGGSAGLGITLGVVAFIVATGYNLHLRRRR